jgi:predicted alpha/beta-hydrolase family hydrolase
MTRAMADDVAPLSVVASRSSGDVDALFLRPPGAHALLVLAHGAGADMRHAFMNAIAAALADRGVATLRYQFPYMQKRTRRIDPQPILRATVRAAATFGGELAPDLPRFSGGKSMGGRMSSLAAAEGGLDARGIVFVGFPLHPANRPGTERADHLARVELPMLFVQGTRDALAPLESLRPIVGALPRATLHVVDGADHGFAVLERSGRTNAEALAEIADAVSTWIDARIEEAG